jgi:hypothetical protein
VVGVVVVPPADGAIVIPGVVVVVVDEEPPPVAPNATAPIAPPPNIAARKPAVTSPLRIPFMNLLRRLPGGSLATIRDRWGFS